MKTERLYWPGVEFVLRHSGGRVTVTTGEGNYPEDVAARLMKRFAGNGMRRLNEGALTSPEEIKESADATHASAHRMGGILPIKDGDKERQREQKYTRDTPGAKIPSIQALVEKNESERKALRDAKLANKKANEEARRARVQARLDAKLARKVKPRAVAADGTVTGESLAEVRALAGVPHKDYEDPTARDKRIAEAAQAPAANAPTEPVPTE